MTPEQAIEQAKAILDMDPLPDYAEEQIEALAEEAGAEVDHVFGGLLEALFVRMNQG